jgi:peptidyl-prolyl cis-trans isomerase C
MKQKTLAAVTAALLATALALPAAAQNVAVVNGKPIPQARLDALAAQIRQQSERTGQPVPPDLEKQLKNEVIMREIFMQEADSRGLQASPDFLAKMDLARQSVLINELFADYSKKNPVTDAEAKAEYDRVIGSQAQATAGAKEYEAHHILVEKEADAKAIIAQLKKDPKKFEEIAKKQSKDPGSGAKGGDLGWANPAGYVPEFAEALKKLNKGQTTDAPVQTKFGWHIIRLDDIRDAKAPELPKFEDVKAQIKRHLEQQSLAKFQEDLREKAKCDGGPCFDTGPTPPGPLPTAPASAASKAASQ